MLRTVDVLYLALGAATATTIVLVLTTLGLYYSKYVSHIDWSQWPEKRTEILLALIKYPAMDMVSSTNWRRWARFAIPTVACAFVLTWLLAFAAVGAIVVIT